MFFFLFCFFLNWIGQKLALWFVNVVEECKQRGVGGLLLWSVWEVSEHLSRAQQSLLNWIALDLPSLHLNKRQCYDQPVNQSSFPVLFLRALLLVLQL